MNFEQKYSFSIIARAVSSFITLSIALFGFAEMIYVETLISNRNTEADENNEALITDLKDHYYFEVVFFFVVACLELAAGLLLVNMYLKRKIQGPDREKVVATDLQFCICMFLMRITQAVIQSGWIIYARAFDSEYLSHREEINEDNDLSLYMELDHQTIILAYALLAMETLIILQSAYALVIIF